MSFFRCKRLETRAERREGEARNKSREARRRSKKQEPRGAHNFFEAWRLCAIKKKKLVSPQFCGAGLCENKSSADNWF
jgi:hypothetical protein